MKVSVIGAGPIGAYAAALAAEKHEVTLYETEPRGSKPYAKCGEGIWESKLRAMDMEPDKAWIQNTLTKMRLGFEFDGKTVYKEMKIEDYYILDRLKFRDALVRRAEERGASIKFDHRIEAPAKLACDMKFSAYGPSNRIEHVHGLQFDVKNADIDESYKTVIFSDRVGVRYFYIFPKGNGKANVGVVLETKHRRNVLGEFCSNQEGLKCAEMEYEFMKAISSGRPITRRNDQNGIVLGDAGCYCDPISSGGIGHGMLAAKHAVESLDSPEPHLEFLNRSKELREKLEHAYKLSLMVYPEAPLKKKRNFYIDMWGEYFSPYEPLQKEKRAVFRKIINKLDATDGKFSSLYSILRSVETEL